MAQPAPPADAGDGSMETILASIRRIIREDEAATSPPAAASNPVAEAMADEDDLLVLEPSMMVQPKIEKEVAMPADIVSQMDASRLAAELAAALFDDEPVPTPPPAPALQPAAAPPPAPRPPAALAPEPVPETIQPKPTHALTEPASDTLLAPQTRSAAAQSFAALQEMLKPEPPAPGGLRLLRSGGPTIEDMVREELRVQLKDWFDAHLPEMVERLVREEIERLVRPA